MHSETKGRNGLASLFVAMVCSALVAPCLAKESQAPLNFNVVSKLNWEECGELNNHTLECKRLHVFRFSIRLTRKGSRLDVPMDHFNKSSDKTFSIPLIRMLATDASATGDRHILMNPGGPGGMLKLQ